MCCMWHPTDPDMAISGGEDYYLALWRPSKQTTTRPVKRVKKNKQHVPHKIEVTNCAVDFTYNIYFVVRFVFLIEDYMDG